MATLMIQLESEKFKYYDMDFEECEKKTSMILR